VSQFDPETVERHAIDLRYGNLWYVDSADYSELLALYHARGERIKDLERKEEQLLATGEGLAAQLPRWIDCKYELPRASDINGQGIPYSDEVLVVYTASFNIRTVSAAIMKGSTWFDRFDDALDDVTHWQPLPAPPKAEEVDSV
jgi:hypothetical protein